MSPRPVLVTDEVTPRLSMATEVFPGRVGISLEEFAQAIGIGRTTVYLAAQRGEIPTRRVGRRVIVPLAALDRWFADNPSAA